MLKGIPVSGETYELTWFMLVDRFHKPRFLATSLVNFLISTPVVVKESLSSLQVFLSVVEDNTAVLRSLNTEDLGKFLLFALSFRCLTG